MSLTFAIPSRGGRPPIYKWSWGAGLSLRRLRSQHPTGHDKRKRHDPFPFVLRPTLSRTFSCRRTSSSTVPPFPLHPFHLTSGRALNILTVTTPKCLVSPRHDRWLVKTELRHGSRGLIFSWTFVPNFSESLSDSYPGFSRDPKNRRVSFPRGGQQRSLWLFQIPDLLIMSEKRSERDYGLVRVPYKRFPSR